MRAPTKAMQFIEAQAQSIHLDTKEIYSKTKALLQLYQSVVWSVKNRADNLRREITGTYGMQLNTALIYLSDLAPEKTKTGFEASVATLFQSKWIIELLDLSLQCVRDYPLYGETYAELLHLRFMNEIRRSDADVSELLALERSTYYDRKKEAIMLMGLSLWGFVVPNTLDTYHRVSMLSVSEKDFFALVAEDQERKRSSQKF